MATHLHYEEPDELKMQAVGLRREGGHVLAQIADSRHGQRQAEDLR